MKDIKIVIATHKKYAMPKDQIYLPLQVGAASNTEIGYLKDNTGENISLKNPYYCELTALYWAWKNIDAKYIGLVHYRRHFSYKKKGKNKFSNILNSQEASGLLENTDIILPKKRHYYIETLYNHYKHTLYIEPLDETKKVISELYPEYIPFFNKLYTRRSAHMFNMFIMKKEILDNYCTWLFTILEELESRIDTTNYDQFHARFYGRISELLLDVYLNKNNLKYQEINVMHMEKINWLKKGSSFIKAKLTNKKYDKSF